MNLRMEADAYIYKYIQLCWGEQGQIHESLSEYSRTLYPNFAVSFELQGYKKLGPLDFVFISGGLSYKTLSRWFWNGRKVLEGNKPFARTTIGDNYDHEKIMMVQ